MDKIAFELSIVLLGARSMFRAVLSVYTQTGGLASLGMVMAILSIALGCMFRWLRLVSSLLIGGGVVLFLACIVLPKQLVSFPYGHHSAAEVAALGAMVTKGEVLADAFAKTPHLFISAPVSRDGHRYVALNALGPLSVDKARLIDALINDLDWAFPLTVSGTAGTQVSFGNQLTLGSIVTNHVHPVAIAPGHFSLRTLPDHFLMGTAHHGVIADRRGQLWLFQYGEGVVNEPPWKQLANYPLAEAMWAKMADRVRRAFPRGNGEIPPPEPKREPAAAPPTARMLVGSDRAAQPIVWRFSDGASGWSARHESAQSFDARGWHLTAGRQPLEIVSPAFEASGAAYSVVEIAMAAACSSPASLIFSVAGAVAHDPGLAAQFPLTPCPECSEPKVVRYRVAVGTLAEWRDNRIVGMRVVPCAARRRQRTVVIRAVSLLPR